jgi:predicted dehydrogenase
MKFPSGVLASCSTTYRINGRNDFKIFGTRGSFGLDSAFGYDGIHGARSDGQEIQFPHINQFAAEMDDFAQCILENRPTKVPGEEGLRDVKIMMAIYEAARTGKTVNLS